MEAKLEKDEIRLDNVRKNKEEYESKRAQKSTLEANIKDLQEALKEKRKHWTMQNRARERR